jgi:glycosyltransferase involved in cell wall biosynthesis
VKVFDGVDWYWVPSIARAALLLLRHRPHFVILQWWTGTVAHTYILLGLLARARGAKVILEFHEVIETGEARIPLAKRYIELVAPMIMRLAHAFAVHSQADIALARQTWRITKRKPIVVVPHGPHDHYREFGELPTVGGGLREAPAGACNVLFFGVIRPYKGLEYLIAAFDSIPDDEIDNYWLTVVGETWEGWTLPREMIARSLRRDRITFVDRYVTDAELHAHLAGADVVALPYLRSSVSGPLHVATSYGLPVVITDVGGNPEAAGGYDGLVLVPAADSDALVDGIRQARSRAGKRHSSPHSWARTTEAYEDLMRTLESA